VKEEVEVEEEEEKTGQIQKKYYKNNNINSLQLNRCVKSKCTKYIHTKHIHNNYNNKSNQTIQHTRGVKCHSLDTVTYIHIYM